jgi:hypothetical protein
VRRRTQVLLALLTIPPIAIAVLFAVLDEPRPVGASEGADALATRIEGAVNTQAWAQTGAVSWSFAGGFEHLWDRDRSLHRVRWKDHEVLQSIGDRTGRAWTDGVELQGEERDDLLDKGWAWWANNSFWLNPLAKLRDDGVTLTLVQTQGRDALLVSYASGGTTPGDAFLWHVDEDGRPTAWQMWAQILPVGGLRVTWDRWVELPTGAFVATDHQIAGRSLLALDVQAAATLTDLVGPDDPFALLSP